MRIHLGLGDSFSKEKPNIRTRLNLILVILARTEESIYKVAIHVLGLDRDKTASLKLELMLDFEQKHYLSLGFQNLSYEVISVVT